MKPREWGRLMTYDGWGVELGEMTLVEARERYGDAELEQNDLGLWTIHVRPRREHDA